MLTWFIRICALLYVVAILAPSLQSTGQITSVPHADKVFHFVAYGVMAALVSWGWPKLKLWHVVLIVTFLGVCVEMAQGMINLGRTPSMLDAAANFAGALSSCFALQLLGQSAKNEKK